MRQVSALVPALAALLMVGAGCTPSMTSTALPTTPPSQAPTAVVREPASTAPAGAMETKPSTDVAAMAPAVQSFYVAYTAAEYEKAKAAKRPVVLYFWASWCPICRAEEPKLKSQIEASPLGVAGFRVDFDTQKDMKAAFKVPYQHTTVILDMNGAESARFTGPVSETELMAALSVAAGK